MRPRGGRAATLALLAGVTLWAQPATPGALREFETRYRDGLNQSGIVGSSFALAGRGATFPQITAGFADRDRKVPVDADTIYHWASITKTFTGIAILQLRDHGKLKLDDPAVDYLPELKAVHNPFGSVRDITIRHLLSHSAGFRAGTFPWAGNKPWQPFEPPGWNQILAMLPYTEVEFRPGTKYQYSNLGMVFLGRIIETVTHDDYEVYVDKNILKPLEMYRSYFDTTPYHLVKHRSRSYRLRDGKLTEGVFDADTGVTVSNGGLNAPLGDMVKYLKFLLGQQAAAGYEGVLKRTSLEEMWTPVLPLESGGAGTAWIGLAFFIDRREGRRFVGHGGYQNYFTTQLYLEPEAGAGYVAAYNTSASVSGESETRTDRLNRELKAFLVEKVFPALAAR